MGRSNVGKSSLINRLVGMRGLAWSSKAPGRTRSIHFYRINDRLDFVDLPGYGYAKVPRVMREEWRQLVEAYLSREGRPDLAIHLVDARHEPTDLDLELAAWLKSRGARRQVVLTKADKLSANQRRQALDTASRRLSLGEDEPPMLISAVTGDGIPALWRVIDGVCEASRSIPSTIPPSQGGAHDPNRTPFQGASRREANTR